jgi:hypothetical protein
VVTEGRRSLYEGCKHAGEHDGALPALANRRVMDRALVMELRLGRDHVLPPHHGDGSELRRRAGFAGRAALRRSLRTSTTSSQFMGTRCEWRLGRKTLTSGVQVPMRLDPDPGRDCNFPRVPNGSKVQNRPGSHS